MHWVIDWLDYFKGPHERALIQLAFEGKKCAEIAAALDIHLETVHHLISKIGCKMFFPDFSIGGIDSGRLFKKWGISGMNDPMF